MRPLNEAYSTGSFLAATGNYIPDGHFANSISHMDVAWTRVDNSYTVQGRMQLVGGLALGPGPLSPP